MSKRYLNRATYWPGYEPVHRVVTLWLIGKRRPLFVEERPRIWHRGETRAPR